MTLPRDFEKDLATKNDEELCEILGNAEDYLPEALDLVRAEVERRHVSQTAVASQVQAAAEARTALEVRKGELPLDRYLKVLVLLLGPWLAIFLFIHFRTEGCKRKAKESLIWILYHMVLAFGLAILFGILIGLGVLG